MKLSDDFYVHLYGRNRGVTGSCTLLSIHFPNKKNERILIDCGSFQGEDNIGFVNEGIPFNTKKICCVLITHTHIDHIGHIPLLIKQGYNNPIYMTKPALKIIDIPLNDACKIENNDSIAPKYSMEEIEKAYELMRGCSFFKTIKPHKHIQITFFPNGHLVGSAIIEIIISYPGRKDIRILTTGDYHNRNLFFPIEKIPVQHRNEPYSAILCESTYGNINSSDKKFTPVFKTDIKEAIENGLKIVIPSFATGRTQEILYMLKQMQDSGDLPDDIEIWLAGKTAQEMTERFCFEQLGFYPDMKKFLPKNFHKMHKKQQSATLETLFNSSRPCIILSPSGMADHGSITTIIPKAVSRKDFLIYFPGYCTPISKGYQLMNLEYGDKIYYAGKEYVKKCQVKFTGEISAHAKRDELLDFLKSMATPKSIIVGHGEPKTREAFIEYLTKKIPNTRCENLSPDYGFEITSEGIIKTIAANFEFY